MKHLLLVAIFALFTSLFSQPATALVDLKNANFSDAWIDLTLPSSGYDLKVERAYNSRTLYNGIFGFGWCSSFETQLEFTPEGNLKLVECGAGQETIYVSKTYSEKDVDKTVMSIIGRARAEQPGAPQSYFSDLERRLKTEAPLRAEYASKYNIIRPIADKTRFYANGHEADFIEKNGNNFIHVSTDGSTRKFALNGKMEKIFDRNGNSLSFAYEGKRLKDVTDSSGRKLAFTYFDNGKVKAINGPNGMHTEYKYKNLNDLIWARTTSNNIYAYEYDDLHNMTKIIFPDKSTKEMTYNKNRDWIISYRDQEGCLETYDYQQSTDNPKDHFWSTVVKKCQGKVVANSKYEFWYELKGDRTGKYLKRSLTKENELTTDVSYNEMGKPNVVARNGKSTRFDYFDNGLLKKRISPDGEVTQLAYENPFKKVSRVQRGKATTDFAYDTKGNLIRAANSDGHRVTLSYDNRGRIVSIEDQAKRRVNIKYEERFGKPAFIERVDMGSIAITYNAKGDISSVKPVQGNASVAVQVASTFNSLLDLIQPAGVTLNF